MSFCPQCDGPGQYLGSLGTQDHFRCRNCGWTYHDSVEMPDDEPEPTYDDDRYSYLQADSEMCEPNDGEGYFEGRDSE